MEEFENREKEDVFSRAIRAGKRTYFFDVKATKKDELYLTITESKRKFSEELGKFLYEKHKIFLYQEDFEKFLNGMNEAVDFVTAENPNFVPRSSQKDDSDFGF